MRARRGPRLNTPTDPAVGPETAPEAPAGQETPAPNNPGQPESPTIATTEAGKAPERPEWPEFLQTASERDVRERVSNELSAEAVPSDLQNYHVLLLLGPSDSISDFELNEIYHALSESAPKERDVLLIILSRGGGIEPAYQISKICRAYAKTKFVVAVPRQAKSAATLIALGADEIHMGPVAQLGPIDPQLGGLPALGVSHALKTIASSVEQYPGSADMFARYLRMALTVEQIGYSERVSESAVQYAERLLSTKKQLATTAGKIAKDLVYEYKDHSFVIDIEEAQKRLGDGWIKTNTAELRLAEQLYRYFDWVNLFYGFHQSKRLLVVGGLAKPSVIIFNTKR